MVSLSDSFWYRGKRELGNGLLGKWSIKIFIDLLLLLCLCPKALPCYKLTAFRFFSYSIYLLSFPFSTIFCTSFSFSLAELFAVLDESERLLGEIDGLTKQNQHKVSPWLVFPNTHTDYRRSVYALKWDISNAGCKVCFATNKYHSGQPTLLSLQVPPN